MTTLLTSLRPSSKGLALGAAGALAASTLLASPALASAPTSALSSAKTVATKTAAASGACHASYYTDTRTASGIPFRAGALTAAHRTLKFGTKVRVTNVKTKKSVIVSITDRGPFISGRCLDLTPGAFSRIASLSAGVAMVTYQVVKPSAPALGSFLR